MRWRGIEEFSSLFDSFLFFCPSAFSGIYELQPGDPSIRIPGQNRVSTPVSTYVFHKSSVKVNIV